MANSPSEKIEVEAASKPFLFTLGNFTLVNLH